MPVDQNIIIQGYLHTWKVEADNKKSDWRPMFYILHGPSNKNAARLDWYESEEQFLKNPGMRKALFMEEIQKFEQIQCSPETEAKYGSTAKYLFELRTYRQNSNLYTFKCTSEDQLNEWMGHLTKLLKDVLTMAKTIRAAVLEKPRDQDDIYNPTITSSSSFDVEIDDTAAAIHCELCGHYRLLLSNHHITLADPDSNNPVITWMYRHIRRFGYSEKTLTIEGGSKCGIGSGLFIFRTNRGVQLMKAINGRMEWCKTQPVEDEYSYVSFSSTDKRSSGSETAASGKSNGKLAQNKNLPETTSDDYQQKPSLPAKPASVKKNAEVPQTKMSEVLRQMSKHTQQAAASEEEVYGYSHLDLKMEKPKPNATKSGSENLYGEIECKSEKTEEFRK